MKKEKGGKGLGGTTCMCDAETEKERVRERKNNRQKGGPAVI